jgi:hypothetical protein
MSTTPEQNGQKSVGALDHGLAGLSLSSKTIHADDYLNTGTDVAPAMHVATTFRYNRDPDLLVPAAEQPDVGFQSPRRARGKSADLPHF